ncbi:hypothetical protein ACRRTK_018257 [Alexandromys fortis]
MNIQGSDRKGTLLLLVMSNLLFCQNVHPLPICHSGNCQMTLQELFDRVIMLSHYIYMMSADMFIEFEKRYAQDHEFIAKAINDCPTSSLATPEDKEEAQQVPAYPEAKGNEIYSVWSQFPSLQGIDEESRDLALYNKIRCLRRDSHKVDNYLKLLRCRIVHNNNC